MDNEDKALVQSLNDLVNAMSKEDIGVLITRVQMLEDAVDQLQHVYDNTKSILLGMLECMHGINNNSANQEQAIKHLIWNKPEQALAALRGTLKDAPNVNTDPI